MYEDYDYGEGLGYGGRPVLYGWLRIEEGPWLSRRARIKEERLDRGRAGGPGRA